MTTTVVKPDWKTQIELKKADARILQARGGIVKGVGDILSEVWETARVISENRLQRARLEAQTALLVRMLEEQGAILRDALEKEHEMRMVTIQLLYRVFETLQQTGAPESIHRMYLDALLEVTGEPLLDRVKRQGAAMELPRRVEF